VVVGNIDAIEYKVGFLGVGRKGHAYLHWMRRFMNSFSRLRRQDNVCYVCGVCDGEGVANCGVGAEGCEEAPAFEVSVVV
jgi:hypothetical protein